MLFYLKRFSAALVVYKRWASIIPLSLLVYLAYAAVFDVRFTISQAFQPYNPVIPLAVAHNPVQTIELHSIVDQPRLLFLEDFSLKQIFKQLSAIQDKSKFSDENWLSRYVNESMSLGLADNNLLDITYDGHDPILGKILVNYFSQRLLTRIDDGLVRSKSESFTSGQRPELSGDAVIVTQRSLWDKGRLVPLVLALVVSTLCTFILVAYYEFTNPAFKSEREMAQYLSVPVLGIVPNVDRLAQSMPEKFT